MPRRVGQRAGVQRPGAAEGDQGQAGRVDAPLDRHPPHGLLHRGVDHRQHPVGRRLRRPPGRVLEGRRGRVPVELAQRRRSRASAGMRPATRSASVTVGSVPPRPVAGRARAPPPPCGARPSARRRRRGAAIEPPPAPIVCTSSDGSRTGTPPPPARRPAAGSPSSTRHTSVLVPPMSKVDRVGEAGGGGVGRGGPHPTGGTRQQQPGRGRAAAAATGTSPPAEVITRTRVASGSSARGRRRHDRPQVGVDDGGDGALVLPELGGDLVGRRHVDGPRPGARRPPRPRGRARGRRAAGTPPPPSRVVGHLRHRRRPAAPAPDPWRPRRPSTSKPQRPVDERRRPVGPLVVERRPVLAGDLDDVGEAGRGHQGRSSAGRPRAGRWWRRWCRGPGRPAAAAAARAIPARTASVGILGGRQHLDHPAPLGHQVGERAAGVRPDPHLCGMYPSSRPGPGGR